MSQTAPPPLKAATTARFVVPNSDLAPRILRHLVTTLLVTTGHGIVADDARVCVSEVITNVHRHTRTSLVYLDVTLHPGRVRVAVWDEAWDRHPAPGRDGVTYEERGRGLLLVQHLCAEWGVTWPSHCEHSRKRVWFVLDEPTGGDGVV
ncbi:ATP-binding protein [Streptomyces buecherae]|uniref:ATP-binding protein n=1 Tax=Streptomyces buecherae TaxID=2763006 RepID=UPI003687F944